MTVLLNKLPHDTRSNRDPIRTDLANIALNEKRIKIGPNHSDAERKYIVFANQLLQIPGITEKVAMAIAEKFQTPRGLLQFIDKGNSLEGLTFINSKHEVKK